MQTQTQNKRKSSLESYTPTDVRVLLFISRIISPPRPNRKYGILANRQDSVFPQQPLITYSFLAFEKIMIIIIINIIISTTPTMDIIIYWLRGVAQHLIKIKTFVANNHHFYYIFLQVPLGVLLKNETNHDNMISILQHLHQYVPRLSSTEDEQVHSIIIIRWRPTFNRHG